MINTASISFKDLVMLIHPDRNPDIKDAGDKMKAATMHRKDEPFLYELAVYWGVIKSPDEKARDDKHNKMKRLAEEKIRAIKAREQEEKRRREDNEIEIRRRDVFLRRVNARVFETGDTIYVRTRKVYLRVTRSTNQRVYFRWNDRESYALKRNVRHAHWRDQN